MTSRVEYRTRAALCYGDARRMKAGRRPRAHPGRNAIWSHLTWRQVRGLGHYWALRAKGADDA